jgi:hypothetical protein
VLSSFGAAALTSNSKEFMLRNSSSFRLPPQEEYTTLKICAPYMHWTGVADIKVAFLVL